jgi:hypothetical protein
MEDGQYFIQLDELRKVEKTPSTQPPKYQGSLVIGKRIGLMNHLDSTIVLAFS